MNRKQATLLIGSGITMPGNLRLMPILGGIGLFLFAAFAGLAVGMFGVQAGAAFAALIIGAVAFFLPLRYLVAMTVIVAFVVMGQLIYFARIEKASWLPFLLGLLLLVRLPGELMHRNFRSPWQLPFAPMQSKAVTVILFSYLITLVATTLINRNGPLQVFVSSKEYLFLWGLYFVIAAGLVAPSLIARIWSLLPWLLPLQLPLVLYQRFVVAARRAVLRMGAEWDAVVGAFGGDPDGGGASGAMGIFIVFAITLSVARWRQGTLKGSHCIVIVGSGLVTLLLAEVKFAVLLLPIAFAVAFRREFSLRPVAALASLIVTGTVTALVLFSYQAQFSNDAIERSNSGYFERNFSAATDNRFINHQTGEIGRVAAITFWAGQQYGPVEFLIGHGLGSSRKGDLVTGEAAKRWMFNIARSSLAILLWETGLLGTFIFTTMLLAAYSRAHKISCSPLIPESERSVLLACGAGLIILLLELPYNTDIFYAPQIQILMMLMLGQLAVSGGRLVKAKHGS
ncbi:MAG: hypothetical protein HGA71_11805 [Azonexaceae bacterium]|nr:hypothetical protein [Azonexaceae bacterium]